MFSSIRPGADASATGRGARRTVRERPNDEAARKLALGMLVTLVGGSFWGFSGTAASYLFDHYQAGTLWLMSVRQISAGLLCTVGAAGMALLPARILPEHGSTVVTGSAMLTCGITGCALVRPWVNMPQLGADGWLALAVLVIIGSFLAFMLYMRGVKEIGGMRAGLLGTAEPISATVTSALMPGTVFLPTDLTGFALIIAMVFPTV